MRSGSLARVVMASLGVSVAITLGCGKPPTEPSPPATGAIFGAVDLSVGRTDHSSHHRKDRRDRISVRRYRHR